MNLAIVQDLVSLNLQSGSHVKQIELTCTHTGSRRIIIQLANQYIVSIYPLTKIGSYSVYMDFKEIGAFSSYWGMAVKENPDNKCLPGPLQNKLSRMNGKEALPIIIDYINQLKTPEGHNEPC